MPASFWVIPMCLEEPVLPRERIVRILSWRFTSILESRFREAPMRREIVDRQSAMRMRSLEISYAIPVMWRFMLEMEGLFMRQVRKPESVMEMRLTARF